jgi:predicted transcriptional regulator of viral defense system
MDFSSIQEIAGREPVFETGLLLAGRVDPANVRRQLSRLVASGRLIQLRRGLYALAPPYRKVRPHPFLIANRMVRASYVSRQSALEYYGMIPEHVPVVTSVTTSRPWRRETPMGTFEYRHIKLDFFHGYRTVELREGQAALVATPEKALLDLLYLQPASDSPEYLAELRLQDVDGLDLGELHRLAEGSGSAKLRRAAGLVEKMARDETGEYESL